MILFLSSLSNLDNLIHTAYENKLWPFNITEKFYIRVEFNFHSEPNFKIMITPYVEDVDRLDRLDRFDAVIQTNPSNNLEWEKFNWNKI